MKLVLVEVVGIEVVDEKASAGSVEVIAGEGRMFIDSKLL